MTATQRMPEAGPVTASLPGRGSARIDAVTVLTIYLVLLCALPSALTITALGSVGRPAALWALGAALWWGWELVHRREPSTAGVQPVRVVLFLFLGAVLLSYAWAMLRGLPGDEVGPADSGLIRVAGWAGILLLAADGIPDRDRLLVLQRRIALVGGLMATLGLLQFITGQSLLDWISIPGMSSDTASLAGIDTRGGFVRASGTAMHPLEYGVVLCIAFPIAISLALKDASRSRLVRCFPVAAIGVASALAVSRSALIGLLAAILVLAPVWSWRVRALVGAAATGLVIAVGVLVPGMLGTIRGLFLGITSDTSVVSRLSSYDVALEYIGRFPLIGKGFGTFLPRYHILDNQFLLLAVDLGVVGVALFLGVLGAAIWCASIARRSATSELDRHLGQALIAAIASGGVLLLFFDGFSFPMSAGMLFLVIGVAGAARRLANRTELTPQRSGIR